MIKINLKKKPTKQLTNNRTKNLFTVPEVTNAADSEEFKTPVPAVVEQSEKGMIRSDTMQTDISMEDSQALSKSVFPR